MYQNLNFGLGSDLGADFQVWKRPENVRMSGLGTRNYTWQTR